MDLKKFLPKKDSSNEREYFWSLIIEPGWVQAGIWRVEDKLAQVVLHSPPFSWEENGDLIQAADNALSTAVQGFPENLPEPQKTVFGVASSWVKEGTIKSEYLLKIKPLCSELSLTPIGFVVLPEAIAHLVKAREGSPLNAVLVGVYKEVLEITIFKLGNLLGTTDVSRSVSVFDDVIEGLTRFGMKDSIPSRMLLFNGREGELEEIRQELLKVDWEGDTRIKFLHTPKIEVIQSVEKIFAVSLAGASEIANVEGVESLSQNLEKEEEEVKKELQLKEEEKFEFDQELTPKDMGFVVEGDIMQGSEVANNVHEEKLDHGPDNLEEMVSEGEPFKPDDIHKNVEPVNLSDLKEKTSSKAKLNLGLLKDTFSKIISKLSFRLPTVKREVAIPGRSNKLLLYGGIFFILLIIAGSGAWWFLPKATVTIYVSPKQLLEEFEVTVDTSKLESDVSGKVLSGKLVEEEVNGEKTRETTGTKTVGEKAKGEVVLYRVGSQITLPKGTVLHGPGELRFNLNDQVTVASGSAGTAGTAKVNVSAEDIGAEYNLAKGTTFRVDDYSLTDLEAKNELSFSGGSSREVTTVSAEDQSILEGELKIELEEKAKEKVKEKIPKDRFLIEDSFVTSISSKTFSNKVDDEAENLKLTLAVKTSAVSVDKEDMLRLSNDLLRAKVPNGFVLREDQMEHYFKLKKNNKSIYEFEVRVSANLIPDVNAGTIVEKIKGKSLYVVEDYLKKEVPGFIRVQIRIKPEMPARLRTLPHVSKNIDLEVAAER